MELLYDEGKMREMIDELRNTSKMLEELRDNVGVLSKEVGGTEGTGGALIGDAGEALVGALKGPLCNSIDELIADFYKQADIVENELEKHLGNQSNFE